MNMADVQGTALCLVTNNLPVSWRDFGTTPWDHSIARRLMHDLRATHALMDTLYAQQGRWTLRRMRQRWCRVFLLHQK